MREEVLEIWYAFCERLLVTTATGPPNLCKKVFLYRASRKIKNDWPRVLMRKGFGFSVQNVAVRGFGSKNQINICITLHFRLVNIDSFDFVLAVIEFEDFFQTNNEYYSTVWKWFYGIVFMLFQKCMPLTTTQDK